LNPAPLKGTLDTESDIDPKTEHLVTSPIGTASSMDEVTVLLLIVLGIVWCIQRIRKKKTPSFSLYMGIAVGILMYFMTKH
jgi:hypothetical protein